MQAFSYQPNIKAGLCSDFCGSVTFLVCKTTICLGSQDVVVCFKREILGEENYSKKQVSNIGLWGVFFYIYLLLEDKFTQAP